MHIDYAEEATYSGKDEEIAQTLSDLIKAEENMQTIIVEIKSVYGEDKIYPVCEQAHLLAQLTGNKTLTTKAIELIKQLGYTVNVHSSHGSTL